MIIKRCTPRAVGLPIVVVGVLWVSALVAQSLGSVPAADAAQRSNSMLSPAGTAVAANGAELRRTTVEEVEQALVPYQDPERRRALRARMRTQTAESHAELVEILGLDVATERRLTDLLTDQMIDWQQRWLEARLANLAANAPDPDVSPQGVADEYTRAHGAISELLGAARFGRYIDYQFTRMGRFGVTGFKWRLAADALSRQQREAMVELLAEHERGFGFLFDSAGRADDREYFEQSGKATSMDDALRIARRHSLKMEEASAARLLESSKQLLQASARILTSSQQAVLTAMEAERLEPHRDNIRRRRQDLGLDPDAPIVAPAADSQPNPVRWSVSIAVDTNPPQVLTFVGDVGKPVTFPIGEGLTVEAVPTVYASRLYLDMTAYEALSDGRHAIGNLNSRSHLQGVLAGWPTPPASTVLRGSKGYVVELSITGTAE